MTVPEESESLSDKPQYNPLAKFYKDSRIYSDAQPTGADAAKQP